MSAVVIAASSLLWACTSGGGESAEPEPGEPDPTTAPAPPSVLQATIERAELPDGSPLLVDADDRVTIGGVGSDGDVALVAGTRRTAAGDDSFLLRTEDGQRWDDVTPDGFSGASPFLGGIVRTDDAFVVTGIPDAGIPVAYASDDGVTFERAELAFPASSDPSEGVILKTTVTDGETVVAIGERVEIRPEAGTFGSRIVASRSDDDGTTWEAVPLPDQFFVPDQSFRDVSAAVDGDRVVVITEDDAGPSAFWESQDIGDTWERRGTVAEVLGLDALSPVLHIDDDGLVIAATTAPEPDADLAFWTETADGFERAEVPEHVFGGDGQQLASRIDDVDGVLTITGRTTQPFHAVHGRTFLEVWFRADGEWQRSWDEPTTRPLDAGLEVAGAAPLADGLLIAATEQRNATSEEIEAFEADPPQPGQPVTNPPPARRQIGAVLTVSFDEVDDPEDGIGLERVEAASFGGEDDQQLFDVAVGGDGTVVAVGEAAAGEDETDAAVWVSDDLTTWTRVESTSFGGPGSHSMSAVSATAEGFVAVGHRTSTAGEHSASAWRSQDGRTWTRSVPTVPEAETGAFYAVGVFEDVVFAVGERYQPTPETYRVPLIMRSADFGATWTVESPDVFGTRPIEVLSSVDVVDGRLYVAGHDGVPTDIDGGFSYTPDPVVRSTDDGITWTAGALPTGRSGQSYGVADLGSGPTAFGGFSTEPGGWPLPFATIGDDGRATDVPAAPVILHDVIADDPRIGAAFVRGPDGDADAAIVLLDDDGIAHVLRGAGLVADGDQVASALARVGDRTVVVGRTGEYDGDHDAAVWVVTTS